MSAFRCPHPSHGESTVPLKSNNDRVFECEVTHRFYRREGEDGTLLVDLISSEPYPAVPTGDAPPAGQAGPERLSFMTDVPRVAGDLDFDGLSLEPREWKLLARIDGRSTLEEVRLLSGLSAAEAEVVVRRLLEAGLLEIRRRR